MGKPAATDRRRLKSLSHSFTLDFVVLGHGPKADAQRRKEALGGRLDTMGLTLSEDTTKLTPITAGCLFLGDQIRRAVGTSGNMVPKGLIPDSAIKNYRHKVRQALAPNTHEDSVSAKITALTRLTNGWCQYYRATSSPQIPFNKLTQELCWDTAHGLGRTRAESLPKGMSRY
jgi:Group II intron, maturase-specific domain